MADVNVTLAANRDAIGDLIGAAERSGRVWTAPRAPGKWSPSQVVEHVARSLDESANVVSGAPSKFGKVSVADYARFIELHTRHHCKQMPGAT